MLLTIDIGNTNITMGVFEEEMLLGMFRMTTKRQRTSDEYGFTICGILEHRGIDPKKIDAVIIASVVPDIMHSFTSGIIKYLDTTPFIVSAETDTGVKVLSDNPSRTGPDRIVNAVAGYAIAQGPAIVIDFGTATTYDLVRELRPRGVLSGEGRQCFLRSRSGNRIPSWRTTPSPACRAVSYSARLGRPNIS